MLQLQLLNQHPRPRRNDTYRPGPPPATSDKRPNNESFFPTFTQAHKSWGPSIPGLLKVFIRIDRSTASPGCSSKDSGTPRMVGFVFVRYVVSQRSPVCAGRDAVAAREAKDTNTKKGWMLIIFYDEL